MAALEDRNPVDLIIATLWKAGARFLQKGFDEVFLNASADPATPAYTFYKKHPVYKTSELLGSCMSTLSISVVISNMSGGGIFVYKSALTEEGKKIFDSFPNDIQAQIGIVAQKLKAFEIDP